MLKAIVGKWMPSCIIIPGNLNFKDNKSLPGKLFLFLEFGDGHAWSVINFFFDQLFPLKKNHLWGVVLLSWSLKKVIYRVIVVCVCCQALIFYFPSQSIFGSYRGFLKFWHRPAMRPIIEGFSDISWVVATFVVVYILGRAPLGKIKRLKSMNFYPH